MFMVRRGQIKDPSGNKDVSRVWPMGPQDIRASLCFCVYDSINGPVCQLCSIICIVFALFLFKWHN